MKGKNMDSKISIRQYTAEDLQAIIMIWNAAQKAGEIPYKPLIKERFKQQFIESPAYDSAFLLVSEFGDEVVGFISGAVKKDFLPKENNENTPGYINVILVREDMRGRGIGRALLTSLEGAFHRIGKSRVIVSESSPIQMSWLIPGTPEHDHNKAPGVDIQSPGFSFLMHMGYQEGPREVAMYLNLMDYQPLPDLEEKRQLLWRQGIYTGRWDTMQTYDYDRMCDRIGSEYWRHVIKEELARPVSRPMPVAVSEGYIVGFTGPVDKEPSGRGWFSGICTDPEFERRGIATVLFNMLMQEFILIGAGFSTLFTGDTNHAQRIYLRAGFRVAKRFVVVGKRI